MVPTSQMTLCCPPQGQPAATHPPLCFLSLVHSSRSVNRKTWRSLRAPSTSSTMKLSLSSCLCCGDEEGREA